MAAALERKRCFNHPDRFGHSLCMTCGRTVCQECATSWDGINYCVACLAARRKAGRARGPAFSYVVVLAAAAGLFYAAQKAMVWGSALVGAMWSAGP